MEGFVPLLIGLGIPALAVLYRYLRHRQIERVLLQAAASLGFVPSPGSRWPRMNGLPQIRGVLHGQEVVIEAVPRKSRLGRDRNRTRLMLRVSPPGGVPYQLQVQREGLDTALKKMFTGQDLQLCDADFDNLINITGNNEAAIVSLMSSGTRLLMRQMIGSEGWEIGGKRIRKDITDLATDSSQIVDYVERAVALSQRLGRGGNVAEQLIENLQCEPNPQVRRRNLDMLVRLKRTPAIEDALVKAASSNSWTISVPAAEALGERGLPALAAATISAPEELAIKAILALKEIGSDEAMAVVHDALEHRSDRVVTAAALAAGERKHEVSLAALCDIVSGPRSTATRAAAATALGHFQGEQARAAVVGALHAEEEDVRLAAIRSLARCGAAEEVADLLDIEKSGSSRQRAWARQAVASIQGRLGRVERGWMSMTEETATEGALSVDTAAPEGSLSLDAPGPRLEKARRRETRGLGS
ncbi:MAG: HEAT repeat domain-containing protein [Acidobacteriota bacterium]